MAKINISIDDDLLSRLDKVADDNYMTRSGLVSVACAQFINANELTLAIREISKAVSKIADNGSVDDDTMSKIDDLQRVCNILMATK